MYDANQNEMPFLHDTTTTTNTTAADERSSHTTAVCPHPSVKPTAHPVRDVVWTSDDGTMAKQTATTRWPSIMQDMIDDVAQTTAGLDDNDKDSVPKAE